MENIFTAVKPILVVAKFLGIFPMSFEGATREGEFRTKWLDIAITLLWFCALTLLAVSIILFKLPLMNDSKILLLAWIILTDAEPIIYSFMSGYEIYKRNNIVQFLRCFRSNDEEVRHGLVH